MRQTNFGIEIEMTGLTRSRAANVASVLLEGKVNYKGDGYGTYEVRAKDGRIWKFMSDASIKTTDRCGVMKSKDYSVEMVSPILTYDKDITILQEIIRALRKEGAVTNSSCGIHIHLDGKGHDARTIRNFVNIIYARNDLFYKALGVESERMRFCKKMDLGLVEKINKPNIKTLNQIEDIWYAEYSSCDSRFTHYNRSRYHFLNLHSFFHGTGTVELRGFNGTLHAGEVRSYIAFALCIDEQARTQSFATTKKPQVENEKFAMRIYLNRIGMIGDEFKACRQHLTKKLSGCSAWRFREAA